MRYPTILAYFTLLLIIITKAIVKPQNSASVSEVKLSNNNLNNFRASEAHFGKTQNTKKNRLLRSLILGKKTTCETFAKHRIN